MLNYVEMSCHTKQNVGRPLLIALQYIFNQRNVVILDDAVRTPQVAQVNTQDVNNLISGAQTAAFNDDGDFDAAMDAA